MNDQEKLRIPPVPHCSFCHKTRVNGAPLIPIHKKFLCTSCLADLNVAMGMKAGEKLN